MKEEKLGFSSIAIHDTDKGYTTTPHQLPIYATSSFEFESIDQGIDIFTGKEKGHVYARYGNPTVEAVAAKIAMLEGYGLDIEPWGMMTSSGMSAIATVMMAVCSQGDKILTQGNLYGGTTELFSKIFGRYGVEPVFTNLKDLEQVKSILAKDSKIKAIYFETPANPTLACIDIEAVSNLAKEYGITTIIDNTFLTPCLQQPFKYGVDYIIHSTTKSLNGHGNSIAGIVLGRDQSLYDSVWQVMKLVGTNTNPFDAWLTNIGLKTLALRMEKHCKNAQAIAEFLHDHKKVSTVNYNGLPSHPDHALAQKQMSGFGGMLSFDMEGGIEDGIQFMNKIQFCTLAPTLGDVDTLILHPASMSHLNVPKDIRMRNGITDSLIRLSVGVEDVKDIISDLAQALD